MNAYEKLMSCVNSIREKTDFVPEIGIVLGSGLGEYAKEIKEVATVAYSDIEGFPVSTIMGHQGKFIFGYSDDVPVVVMAGRVHYYEGYPMSDVVLPTRLMGILGAKVIFLTNAAGGVNENFSAGDFMLITDHISTFVPSPLLGVNIDELGPRFPDMSNAYDKELREVIKKVALENNIPLQQGVYCQFTGPTFETPHEVKMAKIIGGDAVGMSTAVEAIAANHMGVKVCGISCISNLAAGISQVALSHQDVFDTANKVAPQFRKLVRESVNQIYKTIK
ncbi:MAG TPA: purine-nucleoside phosphorylase [Anaerovoracaceae bacterium]|nr:purine-nucleoside phosphorylase [Anaerovoracaceae bacterium]